MKKRMMTSRKKLIEIGQTEREREKERRTERKRKRKRKEKQRKIKEELGRTSNQLLLIKNESKERVSFSA